MTLTSARRSRPRTGSTALAVAAAAALALVGMPTASGTGGAAPPALVNPGFEAGLDGWTVTGTSTAAKVESDGHSGSSRLTHWSASDYSVSTTQTLTGLKPGWLTVSAWVKSGGALDASTLGLTGCGVDDATTTPITEQDNAWVRLAVSAFVTRGRCTVELKTAGPGGAWASFDDVGITAGRVTRDIRGGDLSGLAKNEDFGATYAYSDGTPGDAVQILADSGMNLGRLKVWVNPADRYNEITHVVAMGKRIRAAGMKLMVDFHYSDRWADPGAQGVPAAWSGYTPEQLATAVHDHTRAVLDALKAAGVTADYVQVGNEINSGMLWPWGQTWDVNPSDGVSGAQWDNLAAFLKAGAQAVKEVNPKTKVILHLTNINNGIGSFTWWLDEITARSVPFDLIGLSYYGYWHGSLADMQNTISTLSDRYNRDVMVVETAYPFTLADDQPPWENVINLPSELVAGYPATPEGQAAEVRAVQDAVAAAPGGRGIGTVYWEPAWTDVAGNGWDPADPASGNAWENQALFDFNGRLLPAAQEYAPDGPTKAASHTTLRVTPVSLRSSTHPVATVKVDVPRAWGPAAGIVGRLGQAPVAITGQVSVYVDGVVVASTRFIDHNMGTVQLRLPALAVGAHEVRAVYSGSGTVAGSSSATLTVRARR